MTNKPMLSVERDTVYALWVMMHNDPAIEKGSAYGECRDELRALLDKPAESIIDLDALDWESVKEAAAESKWMPPEYMRNEWVADVCEFLRAEPAAQHQGEPVNRLTYSQGDRHYVDGWNDACRRWENKPSPQPTGEPSAWIVTGPNGDSYFAYSRQKPSDRPLYAEQPPPVAILLPDRMVKTDRSSDEYDMCADAHNDCLDAVARLNGVKP